jgi:branched-chain amino acid transport system substrate-binding protein
MASGSKANSGKRRSGVSRRQLMAITAGGAASKLLTAGPLWAADAENVLRVGFVSPRSGVIATLGEGDGYLLEISRKALKNGLTIKDKTYKVEILDRDAQSDPARSAQLAKSLITQENIDFMLVTTTPEVVNPVADACEAAGIPCLSSVMPWEAWYFGRGGKPGQPSPFKWSYHFSFGGDQLVATYVTHWNLIPTNKRVGVMYPNDADGNAVRRVLPPGFEKAGFTVVDPGAFEDGTSDYSAQIALLKREHCEIVHMLCLPPDFATFWRQSAQQGYAKTAKIAHVAKAGSVVSEIVALGALGNNLSGVVPWDRTFPYKSPLTGISSKDLAEGYEAASGKQANLVMGCVMAVLDAGTEALKATSNPTDKAALAKTISTLMVTTTDGLVDFNNSPIPHVVAATPYMGTQWRKTKPGSKFPFEALITENVNDPNVPVATKLLPYNS